jgi:membrane protein YqaA with SNARE-associated domain
MFRRFYRWTLTLAGRPRAVWALGAISFSESSFFPVPPDVILVPMSLARPERAWFYAALCTLTSVAGGMLGYAIGALLYESVGKWLINLYGYGDGVESFRHAYAQYGHWIILIKGLTPIPYKLVTITSGFAAFDFVWFVALSLVTRGARFFVLAGLLNHFGEPIRRTLEKHFGVALMLVAATVVGGFALLKFAF